MKAIIISGQAASGKTTLAELLSEKLKLPVIGGGDILKEMAVDRGYKPGGNNWWDSNDGIKFLKERETNSDFDKEVDRRLLQKIHHGNIVVTSWTTPWISTEGFKIWLNADTKHRAQRMAKRDSSEPGETLAAMKIRDEENYKLYKNLYNIEFGRDKTPFDMVIDTDKISATEVAEMVIKKLKELNLIDAKMT